MSLPTPDNPRPAPPGFWATFPDAARERRYREAYAADDRATARVLLVGGGTVGLAFGVNDVTAGAGVGLMLALRAVMAVTAAGLFVWLRRPRPVPAVDRWLFVWGLAVAGWNAVVQVYRPPGHLGPMAATVSILLITYTLTPLPLWRLATIGGVLVAGVAGVAVWVNPITDPVAARALFTWAASATAIGWAVARRHQTRGRLLFLAAERQADLAAELERSLAEVRTLRGLIRVCAWCKDIHADGAWQQLEQYFGAGGRAEFTHGICPECLAQQATACGLTVPDFTPVPASRGCDR